MQVCVCIHVIVIVGSSKGSGNLHIQYEAAPFITLSL